MPWAPSQVTSPRHDARNQRFFGSIAHMVSASSQAQAWRGEAATFCNPPKNRINIKDCWVNSDSKKNGAIFWCISEVLFCIWGFVKWDQHIFHWDRISSASSAYLQCHVGLQWRPMMNESSRQFRREQIALFVTSLLWPYACPVVSKLFRVIYLLRIKQYITCSLNVNQHWIATKRRWFSRWQRLMRKTTSF